MNRVQLKLLAVVCMVFDHLVRIFPLYWLFAPLADALWASGYDRAADWVLHEWTFFLMFIGRLAAPIFVYGIAMGFLHTHDVGRYLRRLLVTAVLAQVPYTLFHLAEMHRCYSISADWRDAGLNILFTLALGLTALVFFEHSRVRGKLWPGLLAAAGAAGLARLLHMEGKEGYILLIFVFYFTRNLSRRQKVLLFIPAVMLSRWNLVWWAISEQSAGAVRNCFLNVFGNYLGMLATLADNGKQGRAGKIFQYGMYAFYPLHFAALALIGFLLPPLA